MLNRLRCKLWHEFIWKRKTIKELAKEHNHCINWIRKELRSVNIIQQPLTPTEVVLVCDCVFFKRTFGFLVFRDTHRRRNLYWQKIFIETIAEYQKGREFLEKQGFRLQAVVIDGRPGIRDFFADIPVQMCHFHLHIRKPDFASYYTNLMTQLLNDLITLKNVSVFERSSITTSAPTSTRLLTE